MGLPFVMIVPDWLVLLSFVLLFAFACCGLICYGVDLVNSVVVRRCIVAIYVILFVNCVTMLFGV